MVLVFEIASVYSLALIHITDAFQEMVLYIRTLLRRNEYSSASAHNDVSDNVKLIPLY